MSKIKEIVNANFARFDNGTHYSFMSGVNERTEKYFSSENFKSGGEEPFRSKYYNAIIAKHATFKMMLDAENAALAGSRKSEFTELIGNADRARDSAYMGYKNAVSSFLDFMQIEIVSYAKSLAQHIKDYNISTTDSLDKETGLLLNFIDDLEKVDKLKEAVEKLNLGFFVTQMKEANLKVKKLLSERDVANSGKVTGALKNARSATDESYRDMMRLINALAVVEGEKDYSAYIDAENTVLERIKKNG